MLAPNINVFKSVKTAAATVSQVQQSACQQKRTPEFFQDENPPLFVDATVRYTESRLDHRFLANDRRNVFVWCNPESKKFYWQRIDSGIENPSSTDKKIRNSLESSTGE